MYLPRTIVCVVAVSLPMAAAARNLGQYQASPEIEQWVQSLTDKNGIGCCATADGYPAEAVWDTDRDGYRVKIEGHWYPVPDNAVLNTPNRLGYAVVWYWGSADSGINIRCFLPGAGI